ncbi:glycosyltransferase family 4 protein [Cohaesibacter gelatinilyticus]|uniref:Glycosyltransferase involved in cell wall bisynthesis n=1 Tax=Cohaesibacter gelatinilyticus TaxID=372072 RepID=A0A285PFX8_9HYPH|nr:glycosyltransferase family 4 protein [Cohaesibacter gelatinilyticus]SNZ20157.1 Glycosyltransferase involved in cell wall bisynthesis [Cohaesibacter gelatinilyticus]
MKKLCFVATSPFGVNPFLLGHLAVLAENYEVALCVNLDVYPLSENIDPRVKVIHIPIARKVTPFQDLNVLWCLIKIFHREKFDSVHSLMPKAGLLGMMASMMCRVPHRIHTFTGQVWASKVGWMRSVLKLFDLMIVVFATRVFSDSASQSAFLEKELGLSHPVGIMGKGSISGVDMDRFKPDPQGRLRKRKELGVTGSQFVFLYVGRIARDKGVFDLMDAFAKVYTKRQDVVLWMVGPDEEGLSDSLKHVASEANCAISWIGRTSTPEHYMAAADVYVLPSYREGFGLAVIEAAACETPALAYRIDGVIDSVDEGKTGLLVPLKDIEALAQGMSNLAASPDQIEAMGQEARQRVEKDFTAQAISGAWLEYYDTHVKTY